MPRISLDLHVHCLVSKRFPFDIGAVELLMEEAPRRQLDGFALTEHIHASDFWRVHDGLQRRFTYDRGVYRGGRVPVLTGAEVTVGGAGDLIVIGEIADLRELDRRFRPSLSEGHHPTLPRFLGAARDLPLVVIGAHPFRPGKTLARSPLAELGRLDAVEVNGKDTFLLPGSVERSRRLAARLGLPLVGSSDSHLWPQLGVVATTLPANEVSLAAVRACIDGGTTSVRVRRHGAALVRFCRSRKRYLKMVSPATAEPAMSRVA